MSKFTRSRAWHNLRRNPLAWLSAGAIILLVVIAVLGPSALSDSDPSQISDAILQGPSGASWLGTDELGRGVLTQLVYGARTSLLVGVLTAISATILGIGVGAISGFAGGRFDSIAMRVTEAFQVIPTFVLAAVIVALAGPGLFKVIAVIALLAWPQVARLTRGEVMRIKTYEFIDAARCLGIREADILMQEIIPNAVLPAFAIGTTVVGNAILLEAGLAFFGLTSPDVPSWGLLLNDGQHFIRRAWWLSLFPGLAIVFTALSFNLLGDCLGEALNPRATRSAP